MAIIEYEDEIKTLVNKDNHDEFIYDFLSIYDKISKATITKLRKGTNNLAKTPGEVYLKNKLYFKYADNDVLGAFSQVETYVNEISSKPRYIIVTDYNRLLAKDTKTKDSLDIEFAQLPKYFEFFLAWNGIEKADFEKENPADIKAAEYFARIYDQLLEDNEDVSRHGFNLFLIRLLFCLFAEDTGIFKENSFTDFLKMMTADDGSDMNERISELFTFLDKKVRNGDEPAYLLEFPYVNGQLFTDSHEEIIFSKKTRKSIIDAGELIGWSKVNPDILGSMLQAVASEDQRSHLGMHYTSVPNIMKVIKPLFLDDLHDEFEIARGNEHKLNILYNKIGNIKLMDPACGSGNFLIIAYKELRQLEIDIIKELNSMGIATMYVPSVTLNQFYGIEIDDFACDVTRLSLWIAEHQMNKKLEEDVDNAVRPTLPLQKAGAIVCGNALRINWNEILPHDEDDEVYLFGNPPYLGSSLLDDDQKADMDFVYDKNIKKHGKLDYITAWFFKGSQYIKDSKAKLAFVSTNSICQGEQVPVLWDNLIHDFSIQFAYKSYKWSNNAKGQAEVSIIIIGLVDKKFKNDNCILFDDNGTYKIVNNISPYLIPTKEEVIVKEKSNSIFGLPKMRRGNLPNDGGNLILNKEDYDELVGKIGKKEYIKKYMGATEFIKGINRYCLWFPQKEITEELNEALKVPEIKKRIDNVSHHRVGSSNSELVKFPWKFRDTASAKKSTIVIPTHSSDKRYYVPMGVVNSDVILSNAAHAIYDSPIWVLGLLESKMHLAWFKTISGKMGTGYRYSVKLVYNTFPVPRISEKNKKLLEDAALKIQDVRDEEGGTIDELYGSPLSTTSRPMNRKLLQAHLELDNLVDKIYGYKGNGGDDKRLSILFNMYLKKIKEED
ncbi:uncharacterized protein RZ56_12410 [Apilactobacillus kunkeei]|nr:uncharacterized protein RZ56_12410 [Apilactobacillus kunkeei]